MRFHLRGALAVAAAVLVSACSSTEPATTTGQLLVRLTDAPGDYIESATIWISSAYLIPGTDAAGEHIPVTLDEDHYVVTDLTDGVTAALGSATIPVGDYSQLRIVVDRAEVTLKAQYGGSTFDLQTPSAHQSGIKVDFDGPLHVAPGQTVLIVDFEVNRNFVATGPPGAPTGMLFKPVLHATTMDIASTISGTVGPGPWTADDQVTVFAVIPLGGDPNATDSTIVATASPDLTTGAYTLRYLDPRVTPFTVYVTAVGYAISDTAQVTMPDPSGPNSVTGVDFTLTP